MTPRTVARQAPQSMGVLQASILEWVVMPSSRGSSQPRDWTQVSHIADRVFTVWTTRGAQEYWSGEPIPSPGDLPDLGIEPGSPVLPAGSLPAEPLGKHQKAVLKGKSEIVVEEAIDPHVYRGSTRCKAPP